MPRAMSVQRTQQILAPAAALPPMLPPQQQQGMLLSPPPPPPQQQQQQQQQRQALPPAAPPQQCLQMQRQQWRLEQERADLVRRLGVNGGMSAVSPPGLRHATVGFSSQLGQVPQLPAPFQAAAAISGPTQSLRLVQAPAQPYSTQASRVGSLVSESSLALIRAPFEGLVQRGPQVAWLSEPAAPRPATAVPAAAPAVGPPREPYRQFRAFGKFYTMGEVCLLRI